MFGTSGIRGLYGKEVTEELALKIANIFSNKDVIVGRDIRNTGEPLSNAVISGVLSSGKDAINLGIVPTPTLALTTKKFSCNGMMITASHNPPEYNGLKLFSNGLEISRKREKELTKDYKKNKLNYENWNSLGKLRHYNSAVQDHKNLIKSLVNPELITHRKPKVVVDCNGPASVITPSLLEELGCEIVSIHTSLDKFERKSEPNSQNLQILRKKVIEEHADLGIAHDGDADRAVVVDDTGEVLPSDVQLAMMITRELENSHTPETIVTTVEASLIVKEAIDSFGAASVITPVGSLYLAEALEKEKALFGGEPCGEYIFQKGVRVPDGILTAAKFIELFCKQGKLSGLKKKYKTHPIIRDKLKCDDSKKYKLVDKIKSKFISEVKDAKIRDDDGFRVDEKNGWFLIRASGTEPYIRLTMEYKTKDELNKKYELLKDLITKIIN